jgi:hypothetical protein
LVFLFGKRNFAAAFENMLESGIGLSGQVLEKVQNRWVFNPFSHHFYNFVI